MVAGRWSNMDEVEKLARKLIDAFGALEGLLLEEVAVPEDLDDPEGSVDLWVSSNETCGGRQEISVRGRISLPAGIALALNTRELAELFGEELLGSEEFKEAALLSCIMERAWKERGAPSPEGASLN